MLLSILRLYSKIRQAAASKSCKQYYFKRKTNQLQGHAGQKHPL